MNLAELLASTKTESTSSTKPIGGIDLIIGDTVIFSRPLWKEGTSEAQFLNELNDLALSDKGKAEQIVKTILSKLEVRIRARTSSNITLADLLK